MSNRQGIGDTLLGAHYITTESEELNCSQVVIALFPFSFHFETMHDINTFTVKVRLFNKFETGFYILID
tara:strand:- start:349 stop:555 length:207 start_codon:yes stop_codon:yes gene_type:complete